ncbi:hypothetical protein MMC26_004169 [Xylographa opegraphella]|nr:hypothetical protein [Xylographa opegraphella]
MASDVLEAEEVIKRIRKGHGIIEGDLIEELKRNPDLAVALKELHINLRNSVKLLSEELNTKDAHCVLEMIQNADDNSYEPGIKPKLHFHLQPMTLRVDCNEKGFSEADVKAICSIGQSTKPIEGCIGEKGIGFKSCWKIANIVAISSGPYSFKFDRSKDLGMIAPIPAVFPSHEYLDGHTQILLELQTQEKAEHLEEEFKSLPPTLLMFLRRLRHLRIDFGAKAYKEICCEPNQQGDLLYLTTKDKEESGTEVTTKVSYIVAKHKMQAYASEPKRKGVSETEIVLGFPMSADDSPLGATQNAHAILPLRDYGFKFMIQADFLLPASREDILRCPWNQNLLSGIPIAFCQAVKKLNEKPSLRYSWTRYLPDRLPHSFLSPLSDTLREALTDTKVLYSWTGSLEEPRLLVHIPPRFLNRKGSPIMISDQSELRLYLSPKYSWFTDQDSLRKLGVTEFADQDFLNKLKTLYPTKTTKTNDADQKWHEDVAKALNTLSHSRWSTQISHLPLVPLRDGRWISMASVKEAVFLDQPDGMSTPTGIDIQLVDKYATTNPGRLRLYNNLGIKTCSSYEISNLILRKHQTGYQSLSSSRDAAMHLVYLYRARSTKPLLPYSLIWVYDGAKTWVKPKDLYIEIPGQNFFADLFSKDPDCLRFIHSDYITIVRGNEQASWLQWLVETLSLSTQPRLVEEGGLSRAFKSIIKHHDSVTWLNILRDPKRRYKPSNHPNVCEELAGTKVICVDGKVRKLDETVFPTPAIRTVCAKFDIEPPIIKVDDPSYEGWIKLLQPLGVGMKVTVGFYIEALKCIKDTNHVDRTQVFRIYQALAEIQDQAALRKAFLHEDLILKWSLDNASWIAMSACVWNAPLRLRSKIALSGIWPDCEKFFRLSLGVENATLDMIVEEIKRTSWGSDTSDVGMIKSLFTTLIRFAPDYGAEAKRAQIDGFSTGTFFIADRHYLHESFTGKVPILDFSVGEVHKLHKIFDLLNLRNKYLSNVVEEDYNTSGSQELDHRLTTMFRSKANALARCAQYWRPSQAMKDTLQKQSELLGLKVIRVSKITLRRYLTHQGQTISVESEGELQVVPFADGLNVYLPVEEAKLQLVNQLYLPNEIAKFLGILDRSLFIGVILQSNKDVVDTLLDYQGVPKLQDEEFISMDSLSNTEGTGQSLEDYPSLSKIATNQRSTSDSSKSAVIGGKSIVEHGESITRRVSTNRITPTFSAMVQSRPSLEFQMTNLMISSGTGPTTESGLYRSPAAPLSRELMVRNIKSAKERFQEMQTSLKIRGSQSTEFPVEAVNLLDIAKYKPTKRKGRNSRATKNAPQRQNNVSAARDFEIGVSGEQFAFEYLKNAVPDFNETHWTSNLKAFTKLHPDYKDFESYDAPEVSDFVFEDKRGQLTAFLVDRGHEESKAWLAEPPTYYLEVKATTEGHHAPFSMSNWQYKLVRANHSPSLLSHLHSSAHGVVTDADVGIGTRPHAFVPGIYRDSESGIHDLAGV